MSQEPCSRSALIALLVIADQVGGDASRVVRRKRAASRHFYPHQLSVNLDLGRSPGEKIRSLTFSDTRNMPASNTEVGMESVPPMPSKAIAVEELPEQPFQTLPVDRH